MTLIGTGIERFYRGIRKLPEVPRLPKSPKLEGKTLKHRGTEEAEEWEKDRVIARNRRDRKSKSLPLINADDADQKEIAGIARNRRNRKTDQTADLRGWARIKDIARIR